MINILIGTRMADFSPTSLDSSEMLLAAVFEENGIIGVCLIDTSKSILSLGQFKDDTYYTNLRKIYNIRQR